MCSSDLFPSHDTNRDNNFRTGAAVTTTQSITYNFQKNTTAPKFQIEVEAYKGFTHVGMCADMYLFTSLNTKEHIGSRLRGIRDNQYFADSTGKSSSYACSTRSALVVNLDLPIHLFTTNFTKNKLMSKLNFEAQISPFIDFAFLYNEATKTSFYFKDGFYAAGLEGIICPAKWRSLQIRGSIGVDIGRIS